MAVSSLKVGVHSDFLFPLKSGLSHYVHMHGLILNIESPCSQSF
uniref:Uncharacterized protein n=1 Tax=Arundo donax TaxID=35708 RepID=A0A0A9BXY6_ARUDO